MLLNIPQSSGQPPTTKHYLIQQSLPWDLKKQKRKKTGLKERVVSTIQWYHYPAVASTMDVFCSSTQLYLYLGRFKIFSFIRASAFISVFRVLSGKLE